MNDSTEDEFEELEQWLLNNKLSLDNIIKHMIMKEELTYDKIKSYGNQVITNRLEKQSKCLVHRVYYVDYGEVACRECEINYKCSTCAYKCLQKYKGYPIEVIEKCWCGNTVYNFACNKCKSTSCYCGCKKGCTC